MTPQETVACQSILQASGPKCITIFLDFDGVLHPASCSPTAADFKSPNSPCISLQSFSKLGAFEQLLRSHPNTYVVISSAWRMRLNLQELRRFFSSDIQPRIIGITPHIRFGENRVIEIRTFASRATRAGYKGRFLVIDDYAPYFNHEHLLNPSFLMTRDWGVFRRSSLPRYLYLIDGRFGLKNSDIATLDLIMRSVKSPLTQDVEQHLDSLWPQSMNSRF